jgi:tRNA pseudouridine38-40 synthase
MHRYSFHLAYDGSQYFGWQVQPGLPTIQAVAESVLSRIQKAPVRIVASGRTDAGVHALAQVAACDLTVSIPPENLQKAMNRLLPKDIRVMAVARVPASFHPRFHARAKTYRYRIFRGQVCPPFDRNYVWHFPYPLDEHKATNAVPLFVGRHCFRAFAAADERYTAEADMCREVFSASLQRQGDELSYVIRGSGFLKHMVRNIVGALVEVGVGNASADDLRQMLASGTRHVGIRTAPPGGLALMDVEYAPEAFLPQDISGI